MSDFRNVVVLIQLKVIFVIMERYSVSADIYLLNLIIFLCFFSVVTDFYHSNGGGGGGDNYHTIIYRPILQHKCYRLLFSTGSVISVAVVS